MGAESFISPPTPQTARLQTSGREKDQPNAHDSLGLIPSTMITHAYLFDKDKKYVWTFASYEEGDELFSDRNVFPKGCIIKMEKISEK